MARSKRILNEYSKSQSGNENDIKLYMFPNGNFHIQIEAIGSADYVIESLMVAFDKVKELQNECE